MLTALSVSTFFDRCRVSSSKVIITRMEYSALTNEVFRLLLAQNNLPITGSRGTLWTPRHDPSRHGFAALHTELRRFRAPSKQALASQCSTSTSAATPVVVSDDPSTNNDAAGPANSNNITANDAPQHSGRDGVIPPNADLNPAAVETLISHILDQKRQVKAFLPCSLHNLHLHRHPRLVNSNSRTLPSWQAYFPRRLDKFSKFSNLFPPSPVTFHRRPSSL